jgi:hypothetical protein
VAIIGKERDGDVLLCEDDVSARAACERPVSTAYISSSELLCLLQVC